MADNSKPAADRAAAISEFASQYLGGANQDLYEEMMVTLCRLAHDGSERDGNDRGDIKLLNTAIAELRYAMKMFHPYQDTYKVSIFGSSRTPEGHPDYEAAVDFARLMCEQGWMVITGAGDGIMKAGHGGAGREASFGVAIRLPFEQKTNDIIADDPKLVNFKYFFTRKLMFMKESAAVALFPGGFGTQDEGFEALTLIQTGKGSLVPIVMCEQPGGTYWQQWRAYVAAELLRTGMIGEDDMNLFRITDNVEAAVADVTRFYRVYHSSRYVDDDLVIRMKSPISKDTLQRINDEFSRRILHGGSIETCDALSGENGHYPNLPRLRMHYNKKSFGLLRRMIDIVNAHAAPAETLKTP